MFATIVVLEAFSADSSLFAKQLLLVYTTYLFLAACLPIRLLIYFVKMAETQLFADRRRKNELLLSFSHLDHRALVLN